MIAVKNYKNNHWKHFSLKLLSQELNWQNFSYIKFLSQLNVHNTKGGNSMTFHKVNSNWFEYILFIDSECIKNNNIMLHSLSVNFLVFSLKPLLQGQDQGFSVQQIILSHAASNTYLDSDCGLLPLSFICPCNIIINPLKVILILPTLHYIPLMHKAIYNFTFIFLYAKARLLIF